MQVTIDRSVEWGILALRHFFGSSLAYASKRARALRSKSSTGLVVVPSRDAAGVMYGTVRRASEPAL